MVSFSLCCSPDIFTACSLMFLVLDGLVVRSRKWARPTVAERPSAWKRPVKPSLVPVSLCTSRTVSIDQKVWALGGRAGRNVAGRAGPEYRWEGHWMTSPSLRRWGPEKCFEVVPTGSVTICRNNQLKMLFFAYDRVTLFMLFHINNELLQRGHHLLKSPY